MIDPIIQSLNHHLDKEARFDRALKKMIKVVANDYLYFEGFLMDEDEYSFNRCSNDELKELHKEVLKGKHELSLLFYSRIENEARRRINA